MIKRKYLKPGTFTERHPGINPSDLKINQDAFLAERRSLLKTHDKHFVAYIDGQRVAEAKTADELEGHLAKAHPNTHALIEYVSRRDISALLTDTPDFEG